MRIGQPLQGCFVGLTYRGSFDPRLLMGEPLRGSVSQELRLQVPCLRLAGESLFRLWLRLSRLSVYAHIGMIIDISLGFDPHLRDHEQAGENLWRKAQKCRI